MTDISSPPHLDQAELTLIEEHLRHVLCAMGFNQATLQCRYSAPHLLIDVQAGSEGKLLIGMHGAHLSALQHLMRSMLRKHLVFGITALVDVNGYRAHREQTLMAVAEEAARQASRQGRTVLLKPMDSSDRRVIHTALAGRSDVSTTSTGEEPNRRVVIKPIFV